MRNDAVNRRAGLLVALAAASLGGLLCVPRFSDPPTYFAFADQRTILGVPRFMDVVSNAVFAVVGIAGLLFLARSGGRVAQTPRGDRWERLALAVFFAGMILVAAGSACFHLAPSPATLVWDRLPMTLAFMSFFALVAGDRLGAAAGRRLLAPLLAAGLASVLYWRHTEAAGAGDLRFYVFVQFFPVLAVPVLMTLPGRYRNRDLGAVIGLYAAAKVCEVFDAPVFAAAGWISGHTMKHLAAGLAAAWLLRMAKRRF